MAEQVHVCSDGLRNRGRRHSLCKTFCKTLPLVALTAAAWLAAADLHVPDLHVPDLHLLDLHLPDLSSPALAAEVDAVGVPAPIGFADVVERVKPAVVGVRVKIEDASSMETDKAPQKPPSPPGSPFDRYFHQFGPPTPDKPEHDSGIALGSGFFISGDGYIVTNNHVVANGKSIEVTTAGGKSYQAKVVGTDPKTDLALVKVGATVDFPFVRLAAEPPRIGDWVLPVGNPFGLGGTVTAGIVSARGRDIGEGPYDDFIQIDAPVNVGSSGGPTFNVRGEVIGVNTAIFSPSGGSVGVAFDIPADTVRFVIEQLRAQGHVTRGWIGVQIQSVTPAIADAMGLKTADGALIAHIEPDSPAAKGGVEVGDVITSVNGAAVTGSRDLARTIAEMAPGSAVKFGIVRDGQNKMLTVTLAKFPQASAEAKAEDQKAPRGTSVLGLTLVPASAVPGMGERGVVITGINAESRAAETDLQIGDVILDVGRRAVNSPADVRRMVEETRAQSKRAALLRIKRGDTMTFVAVPIA